MGKIVYLPTWMVDFYGFHVGKYAVTMDGMRQEMVSGIIYVPRKWGPTIVVSRVMGPL